MLGSKLVASAKPDGYTLLSANDANIISSRLGKKDAGFDLDSFRYFFLISMKPAFLLVKADSKWRNLKEFLQDAKQNPGKLKYGAMMGSLNHYLVAILSQVAGVELTPVFFKSSPEITTALLGGHIDLGSMVGLAGVSGSSLARILAVAEEERTSGQPDVPTLKEMGYPVVLGANDVLCAPKDIPEQVVSKFTEAHNKVVAKYKKEIMERFMKMDIEYAFLDGKGALKLFKERERQYIVYAPLVGIKLK